MNLAASLIRVSLWIDADTTALNGVGNGAECVHVDSCLGAVDDSLNKDIAETTLLGRTYANSSCQRQLFARSQCCLLLVGKDDIYMVSIVAVACILVLAGVMVSAGSSVVTQGDGFAFAHSGGDGDAVLGIGTKTLNPHAYPLRGKCKA